MKEVYGSLQKKCRELYRIRTWKFIEEVYESLYRKYVKIYIRIKSSYKQYVEVYIRRKSSYRKYMEVNRRFIWKFM